MTLLADAVRLPRAFEAARADAALAALPWATGGLGALLRGTAGASPYLADLMVREASWLEGAAAGPPGDAVAETVAGIRLDVPAREMAPALRQAKRRVALIVALADLGGAWGLDAVTGALTELADRAVEAAFRASLARELARGRLSAGDAAALDDACGLVALAMGKMGARELNYSSDIDLICLFDDARYDSADLGEVRAGLIRAVRNAMGLLSDITADGYVFRTDLRLRPDPSVTPVCVSVSAAEKYYESMGRAWERAAFVKARPAAGAVAAGTRFLDAIRPFVWRRSLDFTAIEDAHAIRKKIRAQTSGSAEIDGRDLKLGPGGIREIEFFAQTRQLIAGGRDPDLRQRGTRAALAALAAKGWVGKETAAQLDADYVRLRTMEHRLQMIRDAQTQSLPRSTADWDRLAALAGAEDAAALRAELAALLNRVHALTEDFFAPPPAAPAPALSDRAARLVEGWQASPALRTARARAIFDRLLPRLMGGFERAAHPDEAMVQFGGFLGGLPSGVQVLSLFEANPPLIDLIVDICSTAPALARYLSSHAGVLDAVIGGDFFAPWPGVARLDADLAGILAAAGPDYERQLDAARRWQKEWHFRIGVHHLRGLITAEQATAEYADLAEATVAQLWKATAANFAARHGVGPARGAVVVAMGSLGARALTAGSDLDLIVIYDADAEAASDGRRPLPARTYYARLTKALITALSARTAAGTLYEVDMRLRPSGRQGPAATAWSGYRTYQMRDAWTWEHLALTRARVVAGDPGLAAGMEAFRCEVLARTGAEAPVREALRDMRRRLSAAKPQAGAWDVVNGPGGQQDVALYATAMALVAGSPERGVAAQLALEGPLATPAQGESLARIHALYNRVKVVSRLLADGPLEPAAIGAGGRALLLRDTGEDGIEALEAALGAARREAVEIIDGALAAG